MQDVFTKIYQMNGLCKWTQPEPQATYFSPTLHMYRLICCKFAAKNLHVVVLSNFECFQAKCGKYQCSSACFMH